RVALSSSVAALYRPFQAYNSVIYREQSGTSVYHSLQATLSRQTGRRFHYLITYTFGKALGLDASQNEQDAVVDPVDPRHRSYGVLPYDRTHVLNATYSYL